MTRVLFYVTELVGRRWSRPCGSVHGHRNAVRPCADGNPNLQAAMSSVSIAHGLRWGKKIRTAHGEERTLSSSAMTSAAIVNTAREEGRADDRLPCDDSAQYQRIRRFRQWVSVVAQLTGRTVKKLSLGSK